MKSLLLLIIICFLSTNIISAQTITNKYDNLGRLTQIIYPDSSIIKYTYDGSGNRISSSVQNGCATKAKPLITANGNLTFCQGDSVILTSSLGNSYLWSNGDTTKSIIAKTAGVYTVSVNYGYSCTLTSNPDTINVNPIPTQPDPITGNNSVCQGSSQTYSISAVTGATSYTWTLPSGWTGSSTTTSITVTVGSTSGNILVHANNGCGSGTDQTLAVSVNDSPVQPGAISGNNFVCQGSSQTYSISAVTGATSYTWTLPSGWTGSSTTTSITTTVGSSGGNILVHANSGCGGGTDQILAVTVSASPDQPGTISGSNSVCQGTSQTYSISPVTGATGYTWTLPSGWTGSSSTTSIATTVGSSGGTISVHANNGCGSSTDQTLTITVTPTPAQPGAISGNNSVCQGSSQTYSISSVTGATDYTWTFPSGWTGSSTNTSITVTAGSTSGNILVHANNGCDSSADQTLAVTVNTTPDQPGTISGSNSVCQGTSQTYSISPVTGATGYTWTLSSGLTGSSATSSITIVVGNNNGNILVHANNGCGSSTDQIFSVTVNSIPPTPTITQNGNQLISSAVSGNQWYLNGVMITGATDQIFNPNTPGTYSVQISENGCLSAFSSSVSFSFTSVPDINVVGNYIQVFPNPVKNMLTILKSSDTVSVLNIHLSDMNGKLLTTVKSNAFLIQIDMTKYASGIYIIWIEDTKNNMHGRALIAKFQ